MEFNVRYNVKKAKGLKFKDDSRTIQSMKDETDINLIMAKYKRTGVLPDAIKQNPDYGDFSEAGDFLTAQQTILKAKDQFSMLSAAVRKEFDNDPAEFLDFIHSEGNHDKLQELGLLSEKIEPETTLKDVVNALKPLGDTKVSPTVKNEVKAE